MKIEKTPSASEVKSIERNNNDSFKNKEDFNIKDFVTDDKPLNQDDINQALEKLNSTVKHYNQDLRFEYHEEAERMMVKVVDMKTQEVIKEAPPEEIIEMVAKIKEMVGMIIDETI